MPTININELHIKQLNCGDNQSHTSDFTAQDCAKCNTICPRYHEYIKRLREEIITLKTELIVLKCALIKHPGAQNSK